MADEQWLQAARRVLDQSQTPMHYTDIKKVILETGLVPPGIESSLEAALFKEIQQPQSQFKSVEGRPGVFICDKPEVIAKATGKVSILKKPRAGQAAGARPKAPASRVGQDRYKAKYTKLKRTIKNMVFMNAAVCDEVVRMEDKVQRSKEERRYLLRRLLQHQTVTGSLQKSSSAGRQASGTSLGGGPTSSATPAKHTTQSIAQILGEVDKRKRKSAATASGTVMAGKKKVSKEAVDEGLKVAKPKKAKPLSANKRLVEPILLDNCGRPVFPIELGNLTIYCLGEIIPEKAAFHSTEAIYPVGFCSTRIYASTQNPEQRCLYTCKVSDLGHGPKFDISPEDFPQLIFQGTTATEAHLQLLRAINQARGVELIEPVDRGNDFFGLTHPTIHNLIQSCPGARKCRMYKWVKFEVSRTGEYYVEEDPAVNVDILMKSSGFCSALKQGSNLRTLLTSKPS